MRGHVRLDNRKKLPHLVVGCREQERQIEILTLKDELSREERKRFCSVLNKLLLCDFAAKPGFEDHCHLYVFKRFAEGSCLSVGEGLGQIFGIVLRGKADLHYCNGKLLSHDKGMRFGDAEQMSRTGIKSIEFKEETILLMLDSADFRDYLRPVLVSQLQGLRAKFMENPQFGALGEFAQLKLVSAVQRLKFKQGQFLYKEGEDISQLHFAKKGLFQKEDGSFRVESQWLGIGDVLQNHPKRRFSCRACHNVQVFVIDSKLYLDVAKFKTSKNTRVSTHLKTRQEREPDSYRLVEYAKQRLQLLDRQRRLRTISDRRGKADSLECSVSSQLGL